MEKEDNSCTARRSLRTAGKTLVMATHNPEILPLADRVCRIHDGKLLVTLNQLSIAVEEN